MSLARAWKQKAKRYRAGIWREWERHDQLVEREDAARRAERALRHLLAVRDAEIESLRAQLLAATEQEPSA